MQNIDLTRPNTAENVSHFIILCLHFKLINLALPTYLLTIYAHICGNKQKTNITLIWYKILMVWVIKSTCFKHQTNYILPHLYIHNIYLTFAILPKYCTFSISYVYMELVNVGLSCFWLGMSLHISYQNQITNTTYFG